MSCAGILTDLSRSTDVFVRFSTVLGSRGAADTNREVRGFAVRFYTEEGNWDIVGNDISVFFIQSALEFPDLIHAGKGEPHNEVPGSQSAHNNFFDYMSFKPESTHMLMWAMADRTIPRSYRMVQGFGVNTYTLINAKGERHFVKFHFTPHLGVHSLVWDEASTLAGQDCDFLRKDLWQAIENGSYPKWDLHVQLIAEKDEHNFEFDILDATKVWPVEEVPLRFVGELELNRNPDNYHAEVEQVGFCTSHVVPGIGFSNDPLLIGRNFSYADTQLDRLGTNWREIPINRPVCPVMNNQRAGKSRHQIVKSTVNYWPNRFESLKPATQAEGGYVEYPEVVPEGIKARMRADKFNEHYNQAQLFYNSLSPSEQKHVQNALCFELDHCDDKDVCSRIIEKLTNVDLNLAQIVAEKIGVTVPTKAARKNHGKTSRLLSQLDIPSKVPTIETRNVAILIADGFDSVAYNAMKAALTAAGALPWTIGVRRGPIYAAGETKGSDKGTVPEHHLEGQRSTMYDAVFIPGGEESIATLKKNGRAIHYIRQAFAHLKAIAATGEAVSLVRDVAQLPVIGYSTGTEVVNSYGVVTAFQVQADSFKEKVEIVKGATNVLESFFYEISQHRNWQRELDGLNEMVAV